MKKLMGKTIKKLVSISLVLCMLMALLSACGKTNDDKTDDSSSKVEDSSDKQDENMADEQENESSYPDYLNLDGYQPIVKEGEEITLSIAVMRDAAPTEPIEDAYFVHWVEERLNINLEIIELTSENVSERKNLMLNSGDLPDMIWNIGISNNDIVKYGVDGGLLLPVSDYMNEELTPNLLEIFETYPDAAGITTAPDGKYYTIPRVLHIDLTNGENWLEYGVFYHKDYMDAAGITERPETLDEFLEMLRAFKALDPADMGVETIYPIQFSNMHYFNGLIYPAFGWAGYSASSYVWDVTTQQVEVPAMQEKYQDYVKFMHTLYSEELMDTDYYTQDTMAADAKIAKNECAVITTVAPSQDNWADYIAAAALTSEHNDYAFVTSSYGLFTGNFFISADTEYPELCVRFLDYLYSGEGNTRAVDGCAADSGDTLDMIQGFYYDEEDDAIAYYDIEAEDSAYPNDLYNWRQNKTVLGDITINNPKMVSYEWEELGLEKPAFDRDAEIEKLAKSAAEGNMDSNYRLEKIYAMDECGFAKELPLPSVYMTEEQNQEYTDLYTVIDAFVAEETAKFIVGQRPLEELDDFQEELRQMGGDEFVELCRELYAQYER